MKTLILIIFLAQTVNVLGQFDCRTDDPIPPAYRVPKDDIQQFRSLMDSLAKANGIFARNVSPPIDSLVLIKYEQHIAKLRSLQKKSIIGIPPYDYKLLFVKTKKRNKNIVAKEVLISEEIIKGDNVENKNWREFIDTEKNSWTEVICFSYCDKYFIVVKCEDLQRATSEGNITTTYFLEKL